MTRSELGRGLQQFQPFNSSETWVTQTSPYLDSQTLQVARGHENQANETLARVRR